MSAARTPEGSRTSARLRSIVLALGIACTMVLALVPIAFADNATLTVTDTAGHPDPAAGLPRTYAVTGTAAAPSRVYVAYRNTGGAPCAPTANSDSGSALGGHYGHFWGVSVNGNFTLSDVFTWDAPGASMFCIWIAKDGETTATPITQTVTFRAPTGTISAAIAPTTPAPGQAATVTVTGSSEAPDFVFATVRTAGTPCSPTYAADGDLPGAGALIRGTSVNGTFSLTQTLTEDKAGAYVICLWLADSSTSTTPIAGPQPIPFTVAAPPRPPVSAECLAARAKRSAASLAVKKTKQALLRARRRATRRRLTRRLTAQRRTLSTAKSNVTVICNAS